MLNVYIQQSVDNGANWDDLVNFSNLTGISTAEVESASVPVYPENAAGEVHVQTNGTLAASTVRQMVLARRFRARWLVAGAGGSSWTFQVVALPRMVGR